MYQSRLISNFYTIRKYNDDLYKLVLHKYPVKQSGYEEDYKDNKLIYKSDKEIINDSKLKNNLSRARSKVFDYAMSNKFDYFVTLTLDDSKCNRYDLNGFIKRLGQFIRDYRKRKGVNTQYLLIPEKHENGAWHMHGLISGICESDLVVNSNNYLEWVEYSKRFGYISIDHIRNHEAVAKYITKYIAKDIDSSVSERNKKSYYVTRGLKLSKKIKQGSLKTSALSLLDFDFSNDYIKSATFNKDIYNQLISLL